MASGDGDHTSVIDTTKDFLRSFSIIGNDESDAESDYAELSPIPETPDNLDENDVDVTDSGGFNGNINQDGPLVRYLPFSNVFIPPVPFDEQRENCWIPGLSVHVEVTEYERQATLKILYPNLYTIKVKHGDYEWTIHRRYKHFKQLYDHLRMFQAKYRLHLYFPKRDHTERRRTIAADLKGNRKQQRSVRLPLRPEALVREDKMEQRMKQLQDYLQSLLWCKSYRNHPETLKFLEVSNLSFVHKLGLKSKEGMVKKCSGGRRINIECCGSLKNLHLAGSWNKRWLLIKDSFVTYIRPEDGHVSDVMLMDAGFSVTCGLGETGAAHGVLIENYSRKLLVKCWTGRKAKEWAETLKNVAKTEAIDYTSENRFGSFAPIREREFARWFVDGRSYFEAVADALERAREEIYITDWWLSPQIYLKRPIIDGEKWRLDVILKRKAEQGVKVFILLYKEVTAALGLKSIYTKQVLMSLSPNIKVLRHPDHISGTRVLLWAHHEKLVIVDQQIAFSGGLDLCYGRWDDHSHRLTDLGSITLKARTATEDEKSMESVRQEISSHTDVSVLTMEDSPNVNDIGTPKVMITPPTPYEEPSKSIVPGNRHENSPLSRAQGKKRREDNETVESHHGPEGSVSTEGPGGNSRETNSQPTTESEISFYDGTDSEMDSSSSFYVAQPVKHQHIEANVVLDTPHGTLFNTESKNRNGKTTGHGVQNRGQAEAGNEAVELQNSWSEEKREDTDNFDESDLEEIHQSMRPFKELHTDESIDEFKRASEVDVILDFDSLKDKEIICLGAAESPELRKKKGKKEEEKNKTKGKGDMKCVVKSSHLWTRRSNRKSLELSIPTYRKISTEKGVNPAETSQGANNVTSPNPTVSSEGKLCLTENEHLRASNSSTESRASEGDPLNKGNKGKTYTPTGDGATPQTASSIGGMSHAASAINALRKMMHRKEPINNNNEGDTGNETPGTASTSARRRWKLALNVSKFDNKLRTPQVPEQFDESLFYNWNAKEPASGERTKSRIMQSLKDGVDKLTHKGNRRGSMDFTYDPKKSQLLVPSGGIHMSKSEENISEFGLEGSTKFWIGKDYVNFIRKDFENLEQPFEDFIDRNELTRMPWHDIGSVVTGKAARDLARHFIGRWNATKLEKCKKNPAFPWLLPKMLSKCHTPSAFKDYSFEVKVQVLRSSGEWSAGIVKTESSIHEAYVQSIKKAKNYIYIENQFFITQPHQSKGTSPVHNNIGNALYERILEAHRCEEEFKVFVVMPLLPAFEGEFGTASGVSIQAVTHWNYSSICRGGNSLMERLAKKIPDPNQYIVFCGLRTWDKLNDKLVTELVYVHSKLMIVDDDTVIIGSANINDRSMMGVRDSEIAVIFEDVHNVDVQVNGKKYEGGKFASALRWTIFREHLGLRKKKSDEDIDLTHITSDAFYKDVWIKRAAVNTTCYEKVFRCLPTDDVKNFAELKQYKSETPLAQTDPIKANEWLSKVKGYLVLIPLQFLKDQSLTPKVGQKEHLLPTEIWT